MAAMSATAAPALVPRVCLSKTLSSSASISAKPVAGLPALAKAKIVCSADDSRKVEPVAAGALATSLMAAAQPAIALVDERMSTEGTGLSLGVSNPLLVWILLGVATIVWALFFTYASTLKEDDDSGLAL
ncbi:hypothetical protein KP509_06G036500 [Ceratopteris richardii]|uniref:PSII 6.1 kDa protein n=2 Tax=Ceratopteris richardii TaxID=49495 RepID=A0A8T2UMS8_CERRI|nr:hypothetical protein KP509_06G036500 [Ceratopteris richardii]